MVGQYCYKYNFCCSYYERMNRDPLWLCTLVTIILWYLNGLVSDNGYYIVIFKWIGKRKWLENMVTNMKSSEIYWLNYAFQRSLKVNQINGLKKNGRIWRKLMYKERYLKRYANFLYLTILFTMPGLCTPVCDIKMDC